MNTITDKWVILKITLSDSETPIFKVFASFYGGYLGSDSWRMNSGIVDVKETETGFDFYGQSGSCYSCSKHDAAYGTSGYSQYILNDMVNRANESGMGTIEVLPFDTNWNDLLK